MNGKVIRRRYCGWGIAAFLCLEYIRGVVRLATSSGSMDNKFCALAREKHLLFLITENLYAGIAYVLLGLAAFLIVIPLWTAWEKRCRPHAFLSAARAFVITFLLHGFFVLRLLETRPYFLNESEYGYWYYHISDWFPSWLATAVFTWLPLGYLAFLVFWYLLRWAKKPLTRMAVAASVLLGCAAFILSEQNGPIPSQRTGGGEPQKKWNVIIIGSDSLRADRLGLSGYVPYRSDGPAAGGVSPVIDELAKSSQVFQQCFTPIASTLESNTSLHSSLYPHSHGFRHMYPGKQQVAATTEIIEPISTVLRRQGYHTMAIGDWCAGFYQMMPLGHEDVCVSNFDSFKIYMSQAVIMAHFAIPLYFDNPLGFRIFPEIESFAQFVTPEVVTSRVERKISEMAEKRQPFFAHVFYSCNHLPYRCTQPYNSMFADPSYVGKNKSSVDFDINEFIGGTNLEDKWNKLSPADTRQISALYDGCTRQFDDCVGRILDCLKTNGLDENTIIIISSDHGDDLYEPGATLGHGLSFHGGDQANHIPMIVHVPGVAAQQFPQTVRSIDVAPSVLDLLGIEKPAKWEGRSFAPWISDRNTATARPFYAETGFPFIQFRVGHVQRPHLPPMDELTFIDESYDYHFVLKPEYEKALVDAKERMLRTERWKITLTPTAEGGRYYQLFHLPDDQHCEHDVAADRADVLEPMKRAIDRWVDEKVETGIAEIFPQGEP